MFDGILLHKRRGPLVLVSNLPFKSIVLSVMSRDSENES